MTNEQLLWLLARLYMVNRRGYITSHIIDLQVETGAALMGAAQQDVALMTDEQITAIFQPKNAADAVLSGAKPKG